MMSHPSPTDLVKNFTAMRPRAAMSHAKVNANRTISKIRYTHLERSFIQASH